MKIKLSKKFIKSYEKLDWKIQDKTDKTLILFWKNPFDEALRNHSLLWKYEWCRSIDVTWDFRIIFIEKSNNKYEIIELINIWTHSQLYK